MSEVTHQAHVQAVVDLIAQRHQSGRRTVIAMAGPPASGKTTLAQSVARHLNQRAVLAPEFKTALLPMDGYHLDNQTLDRLGLRSRKGAVETFDAVRFCAAVQAASIPESDLSLPGFDRERDCVVPNAIRVERSTSIIITEGNYLLLHQLPWLEARPFFTATVFIKAPLDVLKQRLMARWRDQRLSMRDAETKVTGNDLPNAAIVLAQSSGADLVIEHDATDG